MSVFVDNDEQKKRPVLPIESVNDLRNERMFTFRNYLK